MKFKEFFGKFKRKILGIGAAVSVAACTAITSFAAEGDPTFNVSDVSTVLNPVKQLFTFSNIASILALVVGSAAVLVLGWLGVRKVISVIQTAIKSGRLRLG